jgi:uncharacterized membrane protein YcaP (DUF421 family)
MRKQEVTVLTKERVFAQLRSDGFRHLGKVKRLYLEANGSFSVVWEANSSYRLCVLPLRNPEYLEEQTQHKEKVGCTCGKQKAENRDSDVCSNSRNTIG